MGTVPGPVKFRRAIERAGRKRGFIRRNKHRACYDVVHSAGDEDRSGESRKGSPRVELVINWDSGGGLWSMGSS